MSAPSLERIKKIAKELQSLAPELVESILQRLPMSSVIRLSATNNYVRDCILKSPGWHHLFVNEGTTFYVQRLYHLFLALDALSDGIWQRKYPALGIYPIPGYYFSLHCEQSKSHRYVLESMRKNISCFVYRVYHTEKDGRLEKVLHRPHVVKKAFPDPEGAPPHPPVFSSQDPIPPGHTAIVEWQGNVKVLQKLEKAFHELKAQELLRLADLLEKNPTRLKQALDPRETKDRDLSSAIASLRMGTTRVMRAKVFGSKRKGYSHFRSYWLAIIPRDACLHLFLLSLYFHRCKLPGFELSMQFLPRNVMDTTLSAEQAVDIWLQDHPLLDSEDTPISKTGNDVQGYYAYPPDIVRDIKTVLVGMEILYSDYVLPKYPGVCYPRILHPSMDGVEAAPQIESGCVLPTFTIPQQWDYKGVIEESHDERELAWLEALTSCCEYFEQAFPDIFAAVEALPFENKSSNLMSGRPKKRTKKISAGKGRN